MSNHCDKQRNTVPIERRRSILTAFRLHYPGTPAEIGRALVALAKRDRLTQRTTPVPGQTVRDWASRGKPPMWAVQAAARWLDEQRIFYCEHEARDDGQD